MKLRKRIFIGLFMIVAVIGLASCKTGSDDDKDNDDKQEVVEYIVSFDSKGGSSVDSQTVKRGFTITEPTAPTREGYEFRGWYKDDSCTYEWKFAEDVITGNVTLYAKWDALIRYTVTFDSNGGSSVVSQTVDPNQKIVRPKSPTKEGFIFAGWYKESTLQNEFDFVNTEITGNITLYAKWIERSSDPTKVKVVFNTKGGSPIRDYENVEVGSKIQKPADPTREGYTFAGWFKDTTGPLEHAFDFENDVITVGITLFAKWDINHYTITFNSNGGSSVDSQTIEAFEKATRPTKPTKEGFIFVGWYMEASLTHEFDFVNTEILEDYILYAKWVEKSTDPNKVKVIFNSKGGSEVEPLDVTIGGMVPRPANPTRAGYTFVGWFKDTTGPLEHEFDFNHDTVTEGMTLFAKWEINVYTVTFNSNGGSSVASVQVEAFKKIDRPVSPTKTGYLFMGWYSDSTLRNEFVFTDMAITKNMTLYAKWSIVTSDPDKFTVKFNSKDGSYVPDIINVVPGSKITRPADPIREGYRFVGWFKDTGILKDEFHFDIDVVNDNMILYAKWEVSEYKVTFANTTLDPQIVLVGEKVTRPNPDPVKANHTFAGWYEDEDCTKAWDFDTVLKSSITLYAKWEEKLPTDQDNTIKFPFSSFHQTAQANLDSSTGKTNKDLTTGQFTVEAGVKTEAAILNTQGKSVTFTVNGTINNGFVLTGAGASGTTKEVTVELLQGNNSLGTWIISYQVSKTITVDGLPAGTYTITTAASVKITSFTLYEYNVPVELVVHFDSNNGSKVPDVLVNKYNTLSEPTAPTKDGYTFAGWYTDAALQNAYDFSTKVLEEMTLYAKWEETPVDPSKPVFTISYNSQGGSNVPDKQVNEGNKVAAPDDPVREGYKFIGWYDDDSYITKHDFTQPVTQNYTLHARWEETPLVISFVGADIEDIHVYRGNYAHEPATPEKPNYIFAGWFLDDKYTQPANFEELFTKDTTIYVKWEKDPEASDYVEGGQGTVGQKGSVEITEAVGLSEAAYITFKKVAGATGYSVSLKNSSGVIKELDENSVYFREVNGAMRADIFGVVPGSYEATVLPLNTSSANPSTCTFNVGAYDRSGFAHFNYTDGVGAYNDDGSLKKNAIVLWVTDANKNTIELSYKGVTVKGIGNILNSVGADVGGGIAHNGGAANSNQGIIRILGENNIPLVVRFVGCVSDSGLYKKGTFAAGSTPKIDGLTVYDSADYGGTVGDNGHMARMKSGKNVTLEGVGEDAVIDGWGFHFMAESSAPDLGKSFEVRNLTFINTPEDAIGMEGVQASKNTSSALTASVERCWIHNCEFYGPDISGPAEGDKAEGDGSCDFKRGQYLTVSYNYFEGCHKTNLVGSADYSLQFNLTYHHNLWYLCKARGPLARNANIHMYNNAFIGQTDYAMNTRADSYIFSEYNLFYMCKSPQAVEGGAIKSFNDSISSYIVNKGTLGTKVTDKSTKVPNNCQFSAAGIKYDSFDTNPQQSYIPSGDYVLQTDVTLARQAIASKTGVTKDHGKAMTEISMSDISLLPKGVTVNQITTYPSTVTPGKISKTVYAFKLDRMATVTVSGADCVLVNEAGVAKLEGSGSVVLPSGTYMIQPVNFQPGDSKELTMGTFKEITISSVQFEEYNSEELNQQMIAEFEAKVARIPDPVVYTHDCLAAINAAKESYAGLSPELKTRVSASYDKVKAAYSAYLAAGVTYVEGLINAIGTVDENSGSAISSARAAYTELYNVDKSVQVSNLNVLTAAEAAFATYAVDSCIAKIDAIGTVTLESKPAIDAARNEYDALSEADKSKITNRQKLFDAETAYGNLATVAEMNTLIAEADLTSLASCKAVKDAFAELTNDQKALITDTARLHSIFVAYVTLSIDALPATITANDGNAIKEAEAAYNALTLDEKADVTNYDKLTAARAAYDAIMSARVECTFNGAPSDSNVSVTGKYGSTEATIDGVNYAKGLKMESSTSVTFSTTTAKTLTLHVTGGKSIIVDGTTYSVPADGILTVEITSGNHSIQKKTTNTLLYAIFY